MNKQRLKELYNALPDIDCQGKCHDSCGPVPTGEAEQENITRKYSEDAIPTPCSDMTCNQLDRDTKRCTIHEVRPLLCRLFGLVDNEMMRCPYGCEPEFWLEEETARTLIDIIIKDKPDELNTESIRQTDSAFRKAIRKAAGD